MDRTPHQRFHFAREEQTPPCETSPEDLATNSGRRAFALRQGFAADEYTIEVKPPPECKRTQSHLDQCQNCRSACYLRYIREPETSGLPFVDFGIPGGENDSHDEPRQTWQRGLQEAAIEELEPWQYGGASMFM
jgi:hypothetical protein